MIRQAYEKNVKIFSLFLVFTAIFAIMYMPVNVHGDGFTQENLPPASVGDREASLFIKINPPILTKDTVGDRFLQLRLFDANTGEVIKHTSFFVTVDKNGELLMRNLFHTHSGDLTIKIQPTDIALNDVVVYGDQEPFQGGWTSTNDQISVKAPILLESGLYHFAIEIFGIDNDRNIFIPSDAPKFDSWLSVGDIFDNTVTSEGKSYDLSITSYYDEVKNFNFDDSTKTISFSMPFNWDLSRIEKQNIFVHQEIHFPDSFKAFTTSPTYNASVNGFPVTGRMLIADPYSMEGTLILHYLISKENILDVIKNLPPGSVTMDFKLSPDTRQASEKDSFKIKFDSGAVAQIDYASKINNSDKVPFDVTFFDNNGKLLKFVKYGYRIEDSSKTILYESQNTDPTMPGVMLIDGIDKWDFDFPQSGEYKITLAIFSHGLDNLQTLTGIASGSFKLTKSEGTSSGSSIPSWIKNNAGWWASGQIDDGSFVQGIQWLITNKIMKIPETSQGTSSGSSIPSWIKNNAGWWSEGKIPDGDFVQGIQWLITNGIMRV